MKMSVKYTVALQILCLLELYRNTEVKITSNFLAAQTGADPSTIRYIILDLKKKNYINSKPGPGGTTLAAPLETITLFDVYESVCNPDDPFLHLCAASPSNNDADPTLKSMNDALQNHFENYKKEILADMKTRTLADICEEIEKRKTISS